MIIYKPTPKIKAMTFDLDDTLYNNWPYIRAAEKALSVFIHTHYPACSLLQAEDWQRIKKQLLRKQPALCSDMGELRRQTLTKGFAQCGYQDQALTKAVEDCFEYFYFKRSDFKVADSIKKVLSRLAEKVPLVAITNGNANLTQIGVEQYFQSTYKASLSHPMKPSRCMFDLAQAKLNIAPAHILHVGDNLEKDVWAANQAGYSSAWYACDREMVLKKESVLTLPNIVVQGFDELTNLV